MWFFIAKRHVFNDNIEQKRDLTRDTVPYVMNIITLVEAKSVHYDV